MRTRTPSGTSTPCRSPAARRSATIAASTVGRSLRRLRHHVRRRLVGRPAGRDRLLVPGHGCPLRRAHDEAPRRLRAVAFADPASGQGRVPLPARPGRRAGRRGPLPSYANGAVLLRWLRLALQRGGDPPRGRRRAGRALRRRLSRVRHGARARADRSLPAVGPVERHLVAGRREPGRALRRATTTRSRTGSSTTAGSNPARARRGEADAAPLRWGSVAAPVARDPAAPEAADVRLTPALRLQDARVRGARTP